MIKEDVIKEDTESRSRERKSTFTTVIDAITISAVCLILTVVALSYMTKISSAGNIDFKKVGVQALLLYACTVSCILLMRNFGVRKGEQTTDFIAIRREVRDNADKIIKKRLNERAYQYCRDWEEKDLFTERKKVLQNVGLSIEIYQSEYCKYEKEELIKKFPELTKAQVKGIMSAKKIKRLFFDENYLMAKEKTSWIFRSSPSGGITSKKINVFEIAKTFFMSAVLSILSVSLVLELIKNPTYETIIACLIKITFIIVSSVFGLIKGYKFSSILKVLEMRRLAKEQEEFMLWCGQDEKSEKTENCVNDNIESVE